MMGNGMPPDFPVRHPSWCARERCTEWAKWDYLWEAVHRRVLGGLDRLCAELTQRDTSAGPDDFTAEPPQLTLTVAAGAPSTVNAEQQMSNTGWWAEQVRAAAREWAAAQEAGGPGGG